MTSTVCCGGGPPPCAQYAFFWHSGLGSHSELIKIRTSRSKYRLTSSAQARTKIYKDRFATFWHTRHQNTFKGMNYGEPFCTIIHTHKSSTDRSCLPRTQSSVRVRTAAVCARSCTVPRTIHANLIKSCVSWRNRAQRGSDYQVPAWT